MYRRIVAGYDGRDQGRDAVALAASLRAPDRVVIAAAVFGDPQHDRGGESRRLLAESTRAALERVREVVDGDWLELRVLPGHSAAHGLHLLAEEVGADLVVVGSSHRGELGRVLAGSVGERLLNGSSCPVAVAPRGFREEAGPPRVVGAAYDGSDEAASAPPPWHEGSTRPCGS